MAVVLAMAAPASAGWSKPRNTGHSVPSFLALIGTSGPGSEAIVFPNARGGAELDRFTGARISEPLVLGRTGFDSLGAPSSLATAPSGRIAAVWGAFRDIDPNGDEDSNCCTRAVVAISDRPGKVRRQVLSPPSEDTGEYAIATNDADLTVVAFVANTTRAIVTAAARRGRFERATIPGSESDTFENLSVRFIAGGRAAASWTSGDIGHPLTFWTAVSDAEGRFGAPRMTGTLPAPFRAYALMTAADGSQIAFADDETIAGPGTVYGLVREAGGDFGPPQLLGPGSGIQFDIDAAVGDNGDAIVAWPVGTGKKQRVYVARRSAGGAFVAGAPVTPENADEYSAVGVDARGRATVLYATAAGVFARRATRGKSFGAATQVSKRYPKGSGCFEPKLAVAPGGQAIGLWRCTGRFPREWSQAAVFTP